MITNEFTIFYILFLIIDIEFSFLGAVASVTDSKHHSTTAATKPARASGHLFTPPAIRKSCISERTADTAIFTIKRSAVRHTKLLQPFARTSEF